MTTVATTFVEFPLLAQPRQYVACQWDLTSSEPRRTYWLALFRRHFSTLLEEAILEAVDRGVDRDDITRRALACNDQFNRYLDTLAQNPSLEGRLDILKVCVKREQMLRDAGIEDPYRLAKQRENETALALLPELLRELDALSDEQRVVRIVEGAFAGNIFDLGATKTAEIFKDKSVDFHEVRKKLRPRPWLIDDLDRWRARMSDARRHRAAVLFVDNAGCDVVLGMIPFARVLLQRGTRVILTANDTPTLNDITHDELTQLIARIAGHDVVIREALDSGRLELIASGNGYPLIDLTRVNPALAAAVQRNNVDLVVIEGMGRAVETNLDAKFRCDVMKIAMIKDQGVADALHGEVYDLVLRFETAARV